MKKFRFHWLVVGILILAIFNILFFWLKPEKDNIGTWISYAFIHIAYLEIILVPFLSPHSKSRHIFIENMTVVSAVYFIVEFILGSVFILFAVESWKVVLFTQLILFLVNLVVLYGVALANQKTANAEIKGETDREMMKSAMNNLQQACSFVSKEDKQQLQMAYDELKASPAKVDPSFSGLESNILLASQHILDAAQSNQLDEVRKQSSLLVQLAQLLKNSVK